MTIMVNSYDYIITRKLLRYVFLMLCFLTYFNFLQAQAPPQSIVNNLSEYRRHNFQEKLFVHTDKNYYQAGEIIWFKIYNTDAVNNIPADLSKVAYVEVLDSAHQPVLQGKIGISSATGQGSFYIPTNTASGNYILRAYTNWMKNFDPSYYFEKKITVINLRRLPLNKQPKPQEGYKVNFFPEGGNMVSGLQNKVAFKAVDVNGKPFDFKGFLLENNDTILQFAPYKNGLGTFIFTPKAGIQYQAIIKAIPGHSFTVQLPGVFADGYTMELEDDGDKVRITAQTNISSATELYLIAHTRQSVKTALRSRLQNGSTVFTIDRSVFGNGVSHITLFDGERRPVCERLFYKEPTQILDLKLATDARAYTTRKPLLVTLSSSNADTASFSMSVYRIDSLQKMDGNDDIATYLYLTSDLGGYTENAREYFLNKDKRATDNLLLTHGWRRFDWEKVFKNEKPAFKFVPEYSGHIITGHVLHSDTKQPAGHIITYLSSPSLLTQFKTTGSNPDGSFVAEIKNFIGGTHLIAQTNPLNDSVYRIQINDPFSKKYSSTSVGLLSKPVSYPATLLKQSIGMQVQNIYLPRQINQLRYPAYTDTSAFYNTPDAYYNLDNYVRFTTIDEVLREYVTLVAVRRRGKEVYLPTIDLQTNQFFSGSPINLLDGVPVFNFSKFFEFDPLKINTLEVVARNYIYGKSMFDGILNWKTYAPSINNYALESNALILDYPGLQMERVFFSPDYSDALQQESRMPDFRNVLNWTPEIKLISGKAYSGKFYTSDLKGRFVIVAQGLDKNGTPGTAFEFFEVK